MDILDKFDILINQIEKDLIKLQEFLNDPEVISSLSYNPEMANDLKKNLENICNI